MPPAVTEDSGVRQEAADASDGGRQRRYGPLRVALLIAYLLFFALGADWWGLPLARDRIVPWVIGLLVIVSLPDLRSVARGLVVDWLPFLVALSAYDVVRGHVDDGARPHVQPQLGIDEALTGGSTPTVWLQRHFWHGVPSWYDYLAWAVYVTHFFVAMVVAAILWYRSRSLFRRWAAALLTLTALTLGTYALYPAVPPWMASQDGDMAPSARVVADVFRDMGWHKASAYLEVGANPVAALPSLHAAVPMLLLLFLWPRTRNRLLRGVLVAYAVGMAGVLVYGAEHFTFDIALGWAYAALATVLVDALARWRRASRRDFRGERPGRVVDLREQQQPYADEPARVPAQSPGRDPADSP